MELSIIKTLLELTGGPAFALCDDVIAFSDPQAAALGLIPGLPIATCLPNLSLTQSDARPQEETVCLSGRWWDLRIATAEAWDWKLCFLRPQKSPAPGPNEHTLQHTAGNIRLALQELLLATGTLEDAAGENPEASKQAALALRSIYRLRRTAGNLELLAKLLQGSYRLCRQACHPVAATAKLCAQLDRLLQPAGCRLHWVLPKRELPCCLDWPLASALLRELIANGAANTVHGQLHLTMSLMGRTRICFALRNRPSVPLPEAPLHRHAADQLEPSTGAGLGLSLVSIGAKYHGGSFLLSPGEDGTVTALLTLCTVAQADKPAPSPLLPSEDLDLDLVALSQILPLDLFRPEALL